MAKFAPYSRHELRRSRIEWGKGNVKVVVVVTAGAVALICFESVLLIRLVPDTAFKWYLLGAVHVGVIAAFVHFSARRVPGVRPPSAAAHARRVGRGEHS
jgi:hypothetical protein